jgi:hypothetical protein
MDHTQMLAECEQLAADLLAFDGLTHWRVAEAHVRLGATGDGIGVFTCRLEKKGSQRTAVGLGTTRAIPLAELHALLQDPRKLLDRLFGASKIS